MACPNHAEEGAWDAVDPIDEQGDERYTLGMIRDSA